MAEILDKINCPQDLKSLSFAELGKLAREIREEIIATCAKNGGHLAASLGAVELAIALHYTFNSPKDKIIWDVGHQSYAHKLLTGRRERFSTLRKFQGISGFPKREESEHDVFGTGHGSTSLSAALGLAKARDLKGGSENVIAVIGDGALTGGMAFEALNHAGQLKTNLIVILNDNEMFISPGIGALSNYLGELRVTSTYFKARSDFKNLVEGIPRVGPKVFKAVKKVKDGLKYLVVPGIFFEELGFNYLGPIDGHNLELLRKTLDLAKKMNEPIFIHVLTKKGKGYEPAENDATKFHGISAFDPDNGEVIKKNTLPTYTEVFSQTICQLAKEDEKIIAITAAMPEGTGLSEFAKMYPERFFDVGMAEQHAVTFAAGLSTQGFKPVVAIYSTFLQRAYDQVLHDVCLQNLPVTFVLDRAGIVGKDGPTHQGVFDLSFLRSIPNLIIMSPKDEGELRDMLKTALSYPGPIALRYPRGNSLGVKREESTYLSAVPSEAQASLQSPPGREVEKIEIGKGEILREGKDLLILAVGSLVFPALKAGEELAKEGISAFVVNARFVKPLDEDLIIKLAKQTGKVITLEENVILGGFGSAVLEVLAKQGISVKIKTMGLPDKFIEQGPAKTLRERYGLTSEGIVKVGRELK